jgi:cyanophycinase
MENTGLGVLIPIGGAEDRGEEKNPILPFEEKGVLRHVLDEAKGKDSKLILVTTASRIPDELARIYGKGFSKLGCESFSHVHITRRSQCHDEQIFDQFREADVIMFSGGNQSRLPKFIGNTQLHELLLHRYLNEGLVIAGTSAGAMAMSEEMVAGGSASEAFVKGAVNMKNGFSLIQDLIIDTHFVRRGRFGRLAEAVAKYPHCVGIGLAENTGVIIREGTEFQVIGSGMAIIMDPNTVTHNNHAVLNDGTLMSMTGLTTHFLSNGDHFSMKTRKTQVLPIASSYI